MSNLFLEVKDLIEQNDSLNYISYDNLNQERKEFLMSNLWDFTFTVPPAAVYYPGEDFLKRRMRAVSPTFNSGTNELSVVIRHFTIRQNTFTGTTAGTFTIEYQDFEDQAISAWLDDWQEKLGDRENRYQFRKEDTCADGKLTMFNTSRKPIRQYNIRTIQLMNPGNAGLYTPQYTSEDPADMGQISAEFSFEHFELAWKNI